MSGSTGYFETEVGTQVDTELKVDVEAEAEAEVVAVNETEVDRGLSESGGGGTLSGGCWERWMEGMTCIRAECVTTLVTAVRSTSRSSSGGMSSNLR